jgi:hypothetical protein
MTRRDDSRITQAQVDQAKTNNDLQDERAIGVLRRVIMLSPESRSRRAPSQSHAPMTTANPEETIIARSTEYWDR